MHEGNAMVLTRSFVRAKRPCTDGFRWFVRQFGEGGNYQAMLDEMVAAAAVLRRVLPPPRMELRIDVNRPDAGIEAELDTRMILLGAGWNVARLHAQGLLHPPADAANDAIRKRA